MSKKLQTAAALAVSLILSQAAGAHDGAHAELLARPGKLPDVELPTQAQHGTGINGDFNAHALNAHWIKFTLADGRELHAYRKHLVRDARRGESWIGEFEGMPGSQLVLTRYKGVTVGSFIHGSDLYEIQPGRGGRHVMYQVDESKRPPFAAPRKVELAGATGGESASSEPGTAAAGTVQDLLVVYTQASRNRYGEAGVQANILNAVAAANQAYANSGVDLQLNVVHMAETDYAETGDMGVALTALRTNGDGKMDEVHALRDTYGADLVALVDEDANYCGIAYVMSSASAGFAPYAFSVTYSAGGCLSGYTLPHEIGHNQGNMHDRDSSSSAGAYPYSYGFRRCETDGTGFRTIMSYSCAGGTRVAHFANPSVTYNGFDTGIAYESDPANSADTARSMNNTAGIVAAFRAGAATAEPAAPSGLAATAISSSRIDLSWTDNAANESGFEVFRSPDGVDSTFASLATLGSNATGFSDNSVVANSDYWYRVQAMNSAGVSAYSNTASAVTPDLPPVAPTGVGAVASGSQVTVAWSDASANETGFEVGRESWHAKRRRWQGMTTIGSTGAGATSFADAPGSGEFRYSVRAVNSGGPSGWVTQAGSVIVSGDTSSGGTGTGGGGKGGGKRAK